MISLHVYLTPKAGKERELEAAITDTWIAAMAQQPGFASAALLTPLPEGDLKKLGATRPQHTYEVLAFWNSEQERLEWVARPIHDRVFLPVVALADSVSFTVQQVEHAWGL